MLPEKLFQILRALWRDVVLSRERQRENDSTFGGLQTKVCFVCFVSCLFTRKYQQLACLILLIPSTYYWALIFVIEWCRLLILTYLRTLSISHCKYRTLFWGKIICTRKYSKQMTFFFLWHFFSSSTEYLGFEAMQC